MAEKKIKRADGTETVATVAKKTGNSGGYRIGAVAAWILAIGFEVIAALILFGKLNLTFTSTLTQIIAALVLDLACVIVGSLLWKKANHISPASKSNKVKFWLWNNMGLIVCAFAFIPFVVITLTNKEADKKTKTIAAIVAVIALLVGGLVSYDWNPISAEEKDSAVEALAGVDVYWSRFGRVYHTSPDCSHLNHSDELTVGTVEQAIAANRTRLCKTCEERDHIVIKDSENPDAGEKFDSADTTIGLDTAEPTVTDGDAEEAA